MDGMAAHNLSTLIHRKVLLLFSFTIFGFLTAATLVGHFRQADKPTAVRLINDIPRRDLPKRSQCLLRRCFVRFKIDTGRGASLNNVEHIEVCIKCGPYPSTWEIARHFARICFAMISLLP